jgi:hypothetical protein
MAHLLCDATAHPSTGPARRDRTPGFGIYPRPIRVQIPKKTIWQTLQRRLGIMGAQLSALLAALPCLNEHDNGEPHEEHVDVEVVCSSTCCADSVASDTALAARPD